MENKIYRWFVNSGHDGEMDMESFLYWAVVTS